MAAHEGSSTLHVQVMRLPREPSTLVLVIRGRVGPDGVAAICRRMTPLLQHHDCSRLVCDVHGVVEPDAATMDGLARLQLAARRMGCRVHLTRASGELQELLDLIGLREVLPLWSDLTLEPWRKPEQRKELGRIQKEADPGDLPV